MPSQSCTEHNSVEFIYTHEFCFPAEANEALEASKDLMCKQRMKWAWQELQLNCSSATW